MALILYSGRLSDFLAQEAVARVEVSEMIRDAEAKGYVQEYPGIWVLRDAAGEIVSTVEF